MHHTASASLLSYIRASWYPMFARYAIHKHPDIHDLKENVINQIKPPSSTAQWSSNDAHMLIDCTFSCGQGSAWALSMPLNKLQCTVYSDTFI